MRALCAISEQVTSVALPAQKRGIEMIVKAIVIGVLLVSIAHPAFAQRGGGGRAQLVVCPVGTAKAMTRVRDISKCGAKPTQKAAPRAKQRQ
jgi:hypothetical protein